MANNIFDYMFWRGDLSLVKENLMMLMELFLQDCLTCRLSL